MILAVGGNSRFEAAFCILNPSDYLFLWITPNLPIKDVRIVGKLAYANTDTALDIHLLLELSLMRPLMTLSWVTLFWS